MKKILVIVILLIFLPFLFYVSEYGERIFGISKKNVVGDYKFQYKNKVYYELSLEKKNLLILKKYENSKLIFVKKGFWKIKSINNSFF
jgi:hypothetical protein